MNVDYRVLSKMLRVVDCAGCLRIGVSGATCCWSLREARISAILGAPGIRYLIFVTGTCYFVLYTVVQLDFQTTAAAALELERFPLVTRVCSLLNVIV